MNGVLPRAMVLTLGLQVHLYSPGENRKEQTRITSARPPPALLEAQANSTLRWTSLLPAGGRLPALSSRIHFSSLPCAVPLTDPMCEPAGSGDWRAEVHRGMQGPQG